VRGDRLQFGPLSYFPFFFCGRDHSHGKRPQPESGRDKAAPKRLALLSFLFLPFWKQAYGRMLF